MRARWPGTGLRLGHIAGGSGLRRFVPQHFGLGLGEVELWCAV